MAHTGGSGFLAPLYRPTSGVHMWAPRSLPPDSRPRLAKYLSPPLFPVRLRDLPSRLVLHDVPLGGFEVGGLHVDSALVTHPGPTVGYRIRDSGRSLT